MATIYATHGAAALKQISTVTIANTWAGGDTATLTINGKDLIVTIGTGTSTAAVAQAIRDAWNATSRLDSEQGATDATSNFGGQECGEYSEATAAIDDDALSVVVITANRAGVPFTLTVTEATAGSGTATGATAQAATGPWHWDNGDNWSGGSTPANDDVVVFKDQSGPNVGFKYGLPNASKEVTIQHWMSYTGQIGLPPINVENASKPYPEYRQRYVRLDDAGGGTNIAHRFGIGKDGTGSPLINLKHSTLKCTPVVYNTGTPQVAGLKALNICCTANTSELQVCGGSVDFSSQDSGTCAFVILTQTGGDTRGISGLYTTGARAVIAGGTALIGGTAVDEIAVRSGRLRIENQTGALASITVNEGGVVEYPSAATITALFVNAGGTFDASVGGEPFTITDTVITKGGRFLDPYIRKTIGATFAIKFDPSPDLVFGAGPNDAILLNP